jgi:hypothetical protein
MSIGWYESTHLTHVLSLQFVLNLRIFNTKGTNVIFKSLKTAIKKAIHAIIIQGIAATSAQTVCAKDLKMTFVPFVLNILRFNTN